jgi:hypothetical protein
LSSATYGCIAAPQAGGPILTSAAIATIPEPSTRALLLAGFAGLGLVETRRRAGALSA